MKILLTGGGSGGHFYPLIAIAQRINSLALDRHLVMVDMFYMSDSPYDQKSLDDNNIKFVKVKTGKLRIYPSVKNITDMFNVLIGTIQAIIKLFSIYPDIVIAKGGHGSFPALVAARILRIPVIVHESDSRPGRVNLFAATFAESIGVAYDSAKEFFPKEKTAVIGLPIRREIIRLPDPEEGAKYFILDPHIPTIFIYAGSQGAEKINNLILGALPDLIKNYQIIHQCGANNFEDVKNRSSVILQNHIYKDRYIVKPFFSAIDVRHAAALSSLVISRAGSTLFEIAQWHIPCIIIPISHSHGDHQIKNAFTYAGTGGGIVIEESNALPHILEDQINTVLLHKETWKKMHQATKDIVKIDAAEEIARRAILIGEAHDLE
jgi:UDP-N-acetylglucosamine--N-acetylmuramyl-(pentapeptide) pyrophosphoryl-undecaprenol N-acetylglucosamine transferase